MTHVFVYTAVGPRDAVYVQSARLAKAAGVLSLFLSQHTIQAILHSMYVMNLSAHSLFSP